MGAWFMNVDGYTESLDNLIVALCRDFSRREDSVARGTCSARTAMEYRYLNYGMLRAANEVAGEKLGCAYIYEIGEKIGYAYSSIEDVSEGTYKQIKKEVKLNIARKMHLLD